MEPAELVPTKTCTGCSTVHSLSSFRKDATRKDGHRERCRACRGLPPLSPLGYKRCSKCKADKPKESAFSKGNRTKDGCQSWCKECYRDWAETCGPSNESKARQASRQRTKLYGITEERFAALSQAQGGRCSICRKLPEEVSARGCLVVDHDHRTGAVRGLLCHKCNSGIGFLNDSPQLLAAAISYLGTQS